MGPPNFLFLFPDQHRWDWLNCMGLAPVRTPNIDRLAARGTMLTQCRVNSPLCAPARASVATGLRVARHGVLSNHYDLDESSDTFMQRLRAAGYRVAACGKTDLHKHTDFCGLSGWTPRMGRLGYTETIDQNGKRQAVKSGRVRPQDSYMAFLHAEGVATDHAADYDRRMALRDGRGESAWPTPLTRRQYTDDFTGRAALELLDRLPVGQPWHLQVNFPGPHEPFDPPADLMARYDGVEFPPPVAPSDAPVDHQQIRRNYAAMIEGIDDWVGWLIDAVDRRGELDNTIVVYSSDHGEMLGDLGRWFKSVPHDPSVRVPLVAAGPGIAAGRRSEALVELFDLAPTFLELAGLGPPADWDARSLAPLLQGRTAAHRDVQISTLGKWQMACDGRWKLSLYEDGRRELFDLSADPSETTNLAGAGEEAARLEGVLLSVGVNR
ncbi:MAG: Arylsulfatase [Phycisphaerae bacterium]|nr:Arylsulfatase [Phycisphaerae bacterium]